MLFVGRAFDVERGVSRRQRISRSSSKQEEQCGCTERNDSDFARRDCLGGGTVVGDTRWCGGYGIQADFIADFIFL